MSTTNTSPRAIATTLPADEPVILMTREFDAPRALVWKATTEARLFAQWWGPHGYTNEVLTWDVRPGGAWRVAQRGTDGDVFEFWGEYLEVVPPERLVMTQRFGDFPPIHITTELVERDGKTVLNATMRLDSFESRDGLLASGMEGGANQSYERLDTLLATMDAPPADEPELVIARTFDAPRERVWRAYTECEHLRRWFGPKGFDMSYCALDLRPGGVFHYALGSPGGQQMWGRFVYVEVVAPERLVYVNAFSDPDGGLTRHPLAPTWPLEVHNTLTLEERDGKTTVTTRSRPLNPSADERAVFAAGMDGVRAATAATMDQLEAFLRAEG